MEKLNETLQKRGNEYGPFDEMANTAQVLKSITVTDAMTSVEKEAMELICTKIARIVHGNPHNRDSWHDVAGYANLVVLELDSGS